MQQVLSAEQIEVNWGRLLKVIEHYIPSPRKEQVLDMYEQLAEVMMLAPASSKAHFHNAFPGGYVDHVLRVITAALQTRKLWEGFGADINFTEEELVFAALNHDLGKIGDGEREGYVVQTDNWRRDKLKENYTYNHDLQFMLIQDRSLYILQKFGIECSLNEYLGIRLHDGIYDDANKAYFLSGIPESKLRHNIVHVLHQADFLASKVEYDNWNKNQGSSPKPKENKTIRQKATQTIKNSEGLSNLIKNL
jgi:hypothetical protein